jgi:hypothetical protein
MATTNAVLNSRQFTRVATNEKSELEAEIIAVIIHQS